MWELHDRWEHLRENILDDIFSLDEFKQLFLGIWRYFIDVAATGKINNTDLHLFISMAKILGYNHYPSRVHTWEYDAAINFIAGLLKSVADGANSEINSGFIHLQTPFLPSVHIDTFDAQFARLCEEICKNYSYDD